MLNVNVIQNMKEHFSLCLDQGNSATKAGIFNGNDCIEVLVFENADVQSLKKVFSTYKIKNGIISSVVYQNDDVLTILKDNIENLIELTHKTPVPLNNLYKTPETLGKDRLAAVAGAQHLKPKSDILVIDAGTAITYDFIDAQGNYFGGNIAPGIDMRLKALHHFTDKLPLVEAKKTDQLLGTDTNSAILSGVLYGVEFEINGYINALKIKYPELLTFLTGGSTFYFEEKLKNAIFAERNLVLTGLNRILLHNV